jgi:predicted DsbA family dithiol-disulfide isomerase
MNSALTIDIISDVVCPWCYIGKRRIEGALALYAQRHPDRPQPEVRWHPFQLNPDMAPEGVSRQAYVQRKFGARADSIYDRVKAVGASLDIPFAFDNIARQPNTLAAHALIALAEPGPQQEAVVQTLFDAYFIEGQDLTQTSVLVALAERAGLDPAQAQAALADEAVMGQISEADQQARAMGVQGVPFFVFNGRVGVSGAHESEDLFRAMENAEAES